MHFFIPLEKTYVEVELRGEQKKLTVTAVLHSSKAFFEFDILFCSNNSQVENDLHHFNKAMGFK